MSPLLLSLGVVVAFAAALRSTWSPCGLSMLSTVTPLAEAGRGHRYAYTASWFVLGAVVGGATTGLLAAGLAALVSTASLDPTTVLGIVAVAALLGAAVDGGLAGRRPPFHKRQVDEVWLQQYRAWVYGAGFGWQIGTGLATYIMTTAVFLVIAVAALTGVPTVAFGLTVLFGLLRGLIVLLGARITSPARLASFHRRFDAWREPVRLSLIVVLAAVAAVAGLGAFGVAPASAATAALAVGVAVLGLRKPVPAGGDTPVVTAPRVTATA